MMRPLLFCLALLTLLTGTPVMAKDPTKLAVFIGTYTGPKSQGIYRGYLDLAEGTLTDVELVGEAVNPSFLAIHPDHKHLYAVSEAEIAGVKGGAVVAFSIDPKTQKLTKLNLASTVGAGPCHLVVDAKGKNVLVANYGGGSVAVLPIDSDGKVKEASSFIKHQGPRTHGHSINLDSANRFAIAADLGLDKLLVYRFDAEKGTLTPNDPPSTSTKQGAGPRHFAFHPNGKFAYVINESDLTVNSLKYDAEHGTLTVTGVVSTLPSGFTGKGLSTAEIVVHPSGKFVYGSNRGHDSIAIFSVNESDGTLTPVGHQPTGGKTPRNFAVDPTGKYLLAENQGSDTIFVFQIDQKTGKLTQVGEPVKVGSPVCIKFLAVE